MTKRKEKKNGGETGEEMVISTAMIVVWILALSLLGVLVGMIIWRIQGMMGFGLPIIVFEILGGIIGFTMGGLSISRG